jgi:hypothetical protein
VLGNAQIQEVRSASLAVLAEQAAAVTSAWAEIFVLAVTRTHQRVTNVQKDGISLQKAKEVASLAFQENSKTLQARKNAKSARLTLLPTKQSSSRVFHALVESLPMKWAVRHARRALLEKLVMIVIRASLASFVRVLTIKPQYVTTARQDTTKETLYKRRAFHAFLASTTTSEPSPAVSGVKQALFLARRTGARRANLVQKVERQEQAA